jgi:hypothetical protein
MSSQNRHLSKNEIANGRDRLQQVRCEKGSNVPQDLDRYLVAALMICLVSSTTSSFTTRNGTTLLFAPEGAGANDSDDDSQPGVGTLGSGDGGTWSRQWSGRRRRCGSGSGVEARGSKGEPLLAGTVSTTEEAAFGVVVLVACETTAERNMDAFF